MMKHIYPSKMVGFYSKLLYRLIEGTSFKANRFDMFRYSLLGIPMVQHLSHHLVDLRSISINIPCLIWSSQEFLQHINTYHPAQPGGRSPYFPKRQRFGDEKIHMTPDLCCFKSPYVFMAVETIQCWKHGDWYWIPCADWWNTKKKLWLMYEFLLIVIPSNKCMFCFFLWSAILTNIINTQGVFCLKKNTNKTNPIYQFQRFAWFLFKCSLFKM